MVKRILTILLAVCIAFGASAQTVNEVTLVVSGDGETKEAATHSALRSAIEQAFGTFVSANTTILNDELVKDEIVSVTSGNIQKYNELGSVTLPNGNMSVTLQATVSIEKLISYAQNKGSECEFAGATFGANMKLAELNKRNAEAAIDNMFIQLEDMAPYIYDYDLEVRSPDINADGDVSIGFLVKVKTNENTKIFGDLIVNTIRALDVKEGDPLMGLTLYNYNSLYLQNLTVPEFVKEYGRSPQRGCNFPNPNLRKSYIKRSYIDVDQAIMRIAKLHINSIFNFEIQDNIGNVYYASSDQRFLYVAIGSGESVKIYYQGWFMLDPVDGGWCLPFNSPAGTIVNNVYEKSVIPKAQISQISKFSISRRQKFLTDYNYYR
ncbi:hypothetical protein [Alistipes shahii]|jgi:hypothetical protein|uniref:hypothetical protein n=1 Tax=Alistipes shahii TaxID=328814 RepID=UPI00266D6F1B|nr:hypothetical protein [Alistipes shahii]